MVALVCSLEPSRWARRTTPGQLTVHTPYVHLTFVTVFTTLKFDQPYGARSIAPTFMSGDMAAVIEIWLIKVVTPSQK